MFFLLSLYFIGFKIPIQNDLFHFQDCVRVAASYGEEDVAEAWNSCVRLSCLEHGVTVHTAFDLVTPYPEFNPRFDSAPNSKIQRE